VRAIASSKRNNHTNCHDLCNVRTHTCITSAQARRARRARERAYSANHIECAQSRRLISRHTDDFQTRNYGVISVQSSVHAWQSDAHVGLISGVCGGNGVGSTVVCIARARAALKRQEHVRSVHSPHGNVVSAGGVGGVGCGPGADAGIAGGIGVGAGVGGGV
jgi:hypothetical protein